MKFIFFLLIILSICMIHAQNVYNVFQPDFLENTDYRMNQKIIQKWSDSTWEDSTKTVITYDYSGKKTEMIRYDFTNTWNPVTKTSYLYSDGNISDELNYQYESGSWNNTEKFSYFYNDSKIDHKIYYRNMNEIWVPFEAAFYSYDTNGFVNRILWKYWVDELNLVDYCEFKYLNDQNGNVLSEIFRIFENQIWKNQYKFEYTFENNRKTEEVYSEWLNSWDQKVKYEFFYNDEDKLSLTQYYEFRNQWIYISKGTYTFDVHGNKTLELWQNWLDAFNLENYIRTQYSYEENTSVDNLEDTEDFCNIISNYPNPFNPTTTIRFDLKNNENGQKVKIINIKGQTVKNYPINNETDHVVWNGTDDSDCAVSSGIYFYQIITDKNIYTKKMLLLK